MTLTPTQFTKRATTSPIGKLPDSSMSVYVDSLRFSKAGAVMLELPQNIVFNDEGDKLFIDHSEDGFPIRTKNFTFRLNNRGLCAYFLNKFGGKHVHFELYKVGKRVYAKRITG